MLVLGVMMIAFPQVFRGCRLIGNSPPRDLAGVVEHLKSSSEFSRCIAVFTGFSNPFSPSGESNAALVVLHIRGEEAITKYLVLGDLDANLVVVEEESERAARVYLNNLREMTRGLLAKAGEWKDDPIYPSMDDPTGEKQRRRILENRDELARADQIRGSSKNPADGIKRWGRFVFQATPKMMGHLARIIRFDE
jgi:hypothetical protein